jgi:hypothetical protein
MKLVENLPWLSTTPATNFAIGNSGVVDAGGKFATGVNDTGGKLPLVSMTPAVNLSPVSPTQVANH